MIVVFACKSVHFKVDFFRATQLDHRFSEEFVADESIVNDVHTVLFRHFFLKLICREWYSLHPGFFPVHVTVWPALPYVKVLDGEQI